jgi:protein-disulfide isomerase
LHNFDFAPILDLMKRAPSRTLILTTLLTLLCSPAAADPTIHPAAQNSKPRGTKVLQDMLTTQKANPTIAALPPVTAKRVSFDAVEQQGAVIGSVAAPTTIDIFFDFSTGGGRTFFEDLLPQVIERFVKPQKAKLIFHELGLGAEAGDPLASEALLCAGEQQHYLQFAQQGFANIGGVSSQKFMDWAEALGINQFEFSRCLNSHRYRATVVKDRQTGLQRGIRALPGFSINGRPLIAVRSIGEFERAFADASR